jgi:hypothetical protein
MKGYMGSMGAAFLEYGFVDRVSVPPDAAASFRERLVFVRHSVFVCDLKQVGSLFPYLSVSVDRMLICVTGVLVLAGQPASA